MKKAILAVLSIFILSAFGTAFAADPVLISVAYGEDVILVSNLNYADSMIAGVVANKIGASVFVIDKDTVASEVMSAIEDINPENVYIFGGPAVVSEEIEDFFSSYNVVRFFGMTRYGTAAEVARYFWAEGIDRAIIVADTEGNPEDGNPDLVALAKEEAASEVIPLLFVPEGELPTDVNNTLNELGIDNITVIGGNDTLRTKLQQANKAVESFTGTATQLKETIQTRVKNRITNRWGQNTPLVIVAAGNWTDHINAPSIPKGRALLVWSESEIDDTVDTVKEANYSKLFVVGKRALALEIVNVLEAENITVDHIVGVPKDVAILIRNRLNQTIGNLSDNWKINLGTITNAIRDNWPAIVRRCNETLHQFRIYSAIIPSVAEETIDETISTYQDGDYVQAMRKCYQLIQLKNKYVWKYRNQLNKTVNQLVSDESTTTNTASLDAELRGLYATLTQAPSISSVSNVNIASVQRQSRECVLALGSAKALYLQKRYVLAKQTLEAATRLCQ